MSKKSISLLAILTLIVLTNFLCCQSKENDTRKAFIEWAKENALPLKTVEPGSGFENLTDLKGIIGDAKIVALGESRHDAREHFLMKHRLIEYMVEELGFTIFAMEEGLPNSYEMNNYVLNGVGEPRDLLNKMGNWYVWDTEEVLELVQWMRNYNAEKGNSKKVSFFGCDITDPLPGVIDVQNYFEKVDPDFSPEIKKLNIGYDLFTANIWMDIIGKYGAADNAELEEISNNIENLASRMKEKREIYIKNSSEYQYNWILLLLDNLDKSHQFFITVATGTFKDGGNLRDKFMADNINWHLAQNPEKRMIFWAHNFHVIKDTFDLNIPNRPPTKGLYPVGKHLSEYFGDNYKTIGFSFFESSSSDPLPPTKPEMFDAALNEVGEPLFILDLSQITDNDLAYQWINSKQIMRGEGGEAELIPNRSFDVILFTKSIGKTTKTPKALSRFQNLGN